MRGAASEWKWSTGAADVPNSSWVIITRRIRIPQETRPSGNNDSPTDCHKAQAT
jgi:hypothetical protein